MLRNRGSTAGLPTSSATGLNYGGGDMYAGHSNVPHAHGGYQQSYGGYSNGGGGNTGGSYGYAAGGMAAAASAMHMSSDSSKARRRSSTGSVTSLGSGASGSMVGMAMAVVGLFFFVTTLYYRSVSNGILSGLDVKSKAAAMDLIHSLKRDVDKYRTQSKEQKRVAHDRYSAQITNLQEEKKRLQRERDEFERAHANGGGDRSDLEKEIHRLQGREDAFMSQANALKNSIRKESERKILERFGDGPHKVEMIFVMPEDETETRHRLIVETAPYKLVPHAVHLFLEQVAHGLWDHTYIYLNGPHILQIGPQNMDVYHYEPSENDDGRGPQLHKFEEMGLKHLAFPDYHPDFPHQPWTLGFSGRPGGPDIYINKLDNSVDHGPGGQYQHVLHEEGDSCFGKIVEGHEHIAQAFQGSTYGDGSEWHYFFTSPIEIVQARVLNSIQPIPESMLTDQQPSHHAHNGDIKPQMPKTEHMATP